MISFFIDFLTCLSALFRSRYNLGLKILALRQQLGILKRKIPRPRLQLQDRIFWILLRRLWPAWRDALVIVQPETVVALASGWLSVVLAPSIAAQGPGQAKDRCRGSNSHPVEWRTRIPARALPEFTVSF
jgi:hypothetical protein